MLAESLTPDFQLLFNTSPDKTIVLTRELKIVAVSNSYLKTTMRERNIVGRNLFEVFPENPDDPQAHGEYSIRASFERVAQTKAPDVMPVIQYDLKHSGAEKSGFEKRYWRLKTFPILDYRNEIQYFLHRVEDVTEEIILEQQQLEHDRKAIELQNLAAQNEAARKRVEAELQDARLRLDAALDAGEIGTWTFDVVNNRVFADKSLAKIFSVSEEEAAGGKLESYIKAIYRKDRSRVRQIIADALISSDTYEAEYRITQPDKSFRWVIARGRIVRDDNGQALSFPGVVIDITTQKKSAEALRMSEQSLKFALDAGQLGSYQLNITTGELICSEKCKTNFGLEPDAEFTFEQLEKMVHPDDRNRMQEAIRQTIESNQDYDIEYRIIHPDNRLAWILARGRSHQDSQDKNIVMSGVTLDITERKVAEEAMRESQERFQLVTRATYDAIWDWNLVTNEVVWNEGVQQITGYTLDQIKTESAWWYEHIHPEDRERIVSGIHQVIDSGGEHWSGEYRFLRTDGGFNYVFDRGYVVHREGKPIRMLGAMQNITLRKQAEESLRESQKRLALALKSGRAGIFEWDIKNNINIWSPELEELYGVPVGTFEGNFQAWIDRVVPEDAAVVISGMQTALENRQHEYSYEFRAVLPDKKYCWLAGRSRFDYDENNEPVRMVGINIDIDDRKQIEEEREHLLWSEKESRAEAETANRLKDEFLATLSHELRTPLSSILGWSRLLKDRQIEGEQAFRAIETIERNAKSQSQLIEDILDVSRIVSGKLRLDVRPVELASIIEMAIEAVRPAAEAKNIRLQRVIDSGAMISGDADRLQQIIWNLLSNAIKFTPKEGRVQIKLERINSHVEIIVADNGVGISPESLPFIFERFRQSDSSTTRKYGGLGLGLAIVKHLVELHGGTVHAASEGLNKGSVFTIIFPLIPLRSNEVKTVEEAERVHPTVAGKTVLNCPAEIEGLKILLVDDEPDTRDLIVYVLEDCKAQVTGVASVAEALTVIKSQKFDVLISDIGMPRRDGYDLIKNIRQLPPEKGGRIPAVALTAYARVEDRMRVLTAGFHMHVPKPVEPAELIAVVASLASWNKPE